MLFFVVYFSYKYGGCRQVVKTSVCGSDIRGFESHHPPHKKDSVEESFFVANERISPMFELCSNGFSPLTKPDI